MKYLYIELEVVDGERTHTHRNVITTSAKNINFVAERYAASYWGECDGHEDEYWDYFDIMIKVEKVKEISKNLYNELNKLFYER